MKKQDLQPKQGRNVLLFLCPKNKTSKNPNKKPNENEKIVSLQTYYV